MQLSNDKSLRYSTEPFNQRTIPRCFSTKLRALWRVLCVVVLVIARCALKGQMRLMSCDYTVIMAFMGKACPPMNIMFTKQDLNVFCQPDGGPRKNYCSCLI